MSARIRFRMPSFFERYAGRLTITTGNAVISREEAEANPSLRPGHHLLMRISDTGTGMDQQARTRIFEPFYTTKEKGKGTTFFSIFLPGESSYKLQEARRPPVSPAIKNVAPCFLVSLSCRCYFKNNQYFHHKIRLRGCEDIRFRLLVYIPVFRNFL